VDVRLHAAVCTGNFPDDSGYGKVGSMEFVGEHPQLFFLVFARVFALVLSAPLLGSRSIPFAVRTALALLVAYVVAPTLEGAYTFYESDFMFLLVGEAAIGLVMGLFIRFIYSALKSVGYVIAVNMGLGLQDEENVTARFFDVAAISVFVSVSGFFKFFYMGVSASFKSITALDIALCKDEMLILLLGGFAGMFRQTVIIAMPVIAVMLVLTLSIALLARVTPQLSIFPNGWSLSMGVGILVIALVLPTVLAGFCRFIDAGFYAVSEFLSAGSGA